MMKGATTAAEKGGGGVRVCLTVSILDGFVLAR